MGSVTSPLNPKLRLILPQLDLEAIVGLGVRAAGAHACQRLVERPPVLVHKVRAAHRRRPRQAREAVHDDLRSLVVRFADEVNAKLEMSADVLVHSIGHREQQLIHPYDKIRMLFPELNNTYVTHAGKTPVTC